MLAFEELASNTGLTEQLWSWWAAEAFLTRILAVMGHFLREVPHLLLDMSEAFPYLHLEEMEATFLLVGEQWCVYAHITPGQVL